MNGQLNPAAKLQSAIEELKAELFLRVSSDLVKLLLPYGIQYREAERLLGPAFAEAIADSLKELGEKPSLSRIAIQAGVNRHKVKEWRNDTTLLNNDERELSVHARVLKEWHDNPRFWDSSEEPMLLTKSGPGVSFFDLVDSCGFKIDVYAGTVLKDLIQHGTVISQGDWLKVENRHFVSKTQSFESLKFVLISLITLLKTNHYNCNEKSDSDIGRINKLAYADVPLSQANEIEEELRKDANEFLTIMSQKLESFCVDLGDEPTVRIGVGVYGLNNGEDTPDI